jgi:hypothetical protein
MAIEEADLHDREGWPGVARMWYNKAADKNLLKLGGYSINWQSLLGLAYYATHTLSNSLSRMHKSQLFPLLFPEEPENCQSMRFCF